MTATIAAILLAAGAARRMGRCKQLLPLDGKTVISHCLDALLAGGIEEIIVVVGPEGAEVARATLAYPVRVVANIDSEADMAASVRTGRQALSPAVNGVVVALCDYPLVKAKTIACLVEAHAKHPREIIIPCHNGRRGHPSLFPLQLLGTLSASLTLRDLVRGNPEMILYLEVADSGILIDMDTPEDYQKAIEFCKRETR